MAEKNTNDVEVSASSGIFSQTAKQFNNRDSKAS